jgi:uncharacterized protein
MSDLEKNKQAVHDFFRCFDEGRVDDAFAMTTPDFKWWGASGDTAAGTVLTAAELVSIEKEFLKIFDGPLKCNVGALTAEDDRVAVEMETYGTLKNGRIYNNSYSHHFIFREGKICSWREHCNTKLVEDLVGDPLKGDYPSKRT